MEIRRMEPGEELAVSRVYALSWKAAYRGIVPQDYLDQLSLERWVPFLNGGGKTNFVAVEKGRIVGVSKVSPAREEAQAGWGEIISLYLLPEYFGKGIGRALIGQDAAFLESQGFSKIYLWVLEENRRARDFYERNGFRPNGDSIRQRIGGKDLTELRYIRN